jgi:hypothetical protein
MIARGRIAFLHMASTPPRRPVDHARQAGLSRTRDDIGAVIVHLYLPTMTTELP